MRACSWNSVSQKRKRRRAILVFFCSSPVCLMLFYFIFFALNQTFTFYNSLKTQALAIHICLSNCRLNYVPFFVLKSSNRQMRLIVCASFIYLTIVLEDKKKTVIFGNWLWCHHIYYIHVRLSLLRRWFTIGQRHSKSFQMKNTISRLNSVKLNLD